MKSYVLRREQTIPLSSEEVFSFFSDPLNLQAITPPWLDFRILTPSPIAMEEGRLIRYRLRWRHIPVSWTTIIRDWNPPFCFVDEQLHGPYRLWHHTHTFEVVAEGVRMCDEVRYALPFGLIGRLAQRLWVRRDVESIFDYRARTLERLLLAGGGRNAAAH